MYYTQKISIATKDPSPTSYPLEEAGIGRLYIVDSIEDRTHPTLFPGSFLVRTSTEVAYLPNGGWDCLSVLRRYKIRVRLPRPDEVVQFTTEEHDDPE